MLFRSPQNPKTPRSLLEEGVVKFIFNREIENACAEMSIILDVHY